MTSGARFDTAIVAHVLYEGETMEEVLSLLCKGLSIQAVLPCAQDVCTPRAKAFDWNRGRAEFDAINTAHFT